MCCRIVLLLSVLAAAYPQASLASKATSMTFKGRFLGFVEGDSRWAFFCVAGDSILTCGVSDVASGFFVAANAGTELEIEAQVIDTYVSDDGRIEPIYGMTGASLRGYSARKWRAEMVRVLGWDRATKVLSALADFFVVEEEPARCAY